MLMISMLGVTLPHFDDTHLVGGELTGLAAAWSWLGVRAVAPAQRRQPA